MLLNSLEHLAYRVAGLATVIYAAEKTNILRNIVNGNDNDAIVALKTSSLFSGSEFLSDHLLSIVNHVKVLTLYNKCYAIRYCIYCQCIDYIRDGKT